MFHYVNPEVDDINDVDNNIINDEDITPQNLKDLEDEEETTENTEDSSNSSAKRRIVLNEMQKSILLKIIAFVICACAGIVFLYIGIINPTIKATEEYNRVVSTFNETVARYNDAVKKVSVENIEGFVVEAEKLNTVEVTRDSIIDTLLSGNSEKKIISDIVTIQEITATMDENIQIISQITAPQQEYVISSLEKVVGIGDISAVTADNDPNEMLGKEGGYISCIYFVSNNVDQSFISGNDSIEKGTDGGGCVEVYNSIEDAYARCDYLSGFNDTVLYSGSYAIVGTMVIRTSYLLSNEEQYELTDQITRALTQTL